MSGERAHGGIVRRDGDMATLGDGAQWWLNGTAWARAEADAAIAVNPFVSSVQPSSSQAGLASFRPAPRRRPAAGAPLVELPKGGAWDAMIADEIARSGCQGIPDGEIGNGAGVAP